MAGDHRDAIRRMENQLDVISETMRQPPSSNDQKSLVHDMLRECGEYRRQLEDMAGVVLDQEGGEAVFNQITNELDRFQRLQDGYDQWAASGHVGESPIAGAIHHVGGEGHLGHPTPEMSHAASSEGQYDADPKFSRQSSGVRDLGKKEKKKKEKKEKKKHSSDTVDEINFQAPNTDSFSRGHPPGTDSFSHGHTFPHSSDDFQFPSAAGGGEPGHGGTGSGFAGWPPGDAEPPSAPGQIWGGSAPDTAWPSNGPRDLPEAAVFDQSVEVWGSSTPVGSAVPAQHSFNPHGFSETSRGGPSWGSNASAPIGSASIPPPPVGTGGASSTASNFGPFGDDPVGPSGLFGTAQSSGEAGSVSKRHIGNTGGQHATLHIQRPFADIEHDIDAFKAQFVRATAQAAGVAPHRIRVSAVRPGS